MLNKKQKGFDPYLQGYIQRQVAHSPWCGLETYWPAQYLLINSFTYCGVCALYNSPGFQWYMLPRVNKVDLVMNMLAPLKKPNFLFVIANWASRYNNNSVLVLT